MDGEQPLGVNPTAAQVRARFDVLMERLPEFYDHEAWDAQVVAWFLVNEVEEALLHPRAEWRCPSPCYRWHPMDDVQCVDCGCASPKIIARPSPAEGGEDGRRLYEAMKQSLYALPYFDAPGDETKVLRFDVLAMLTKHLILDAARSAEQGGV